MAISVKLQRRLDELRKTHESLFEDTFLEAIQTIKDDAPLAAIVEAIERGEFETVVSLLGIDRAAFRPLEQASAALFEAAGTATASTLQAASRVRRGRGAQAAFRFDVRNTRSENWLRDQSSGLVTRVVEDTRNAVRLRLQEGMVKGSNPRATALDIIGRIDPGTKRRTGGIVGLSGPQEQWLRNARDELTTGTPQGLNNYLSRRARDKRFDSHVNKALRDGTQIPADVQAKMIARYNDNLLKLRGETIARTESIHALNQAQNESMLQAVESGTVRKVRKIWDSAGNDGRTRESHLELDGVSVPINEPFISPATGKAMMFPLDTSLGAEGEDVINCRCRIRHDVDF